MMRVTPLRFTTLQCSQIGFTLVRTFTGAPKDDARLVHRDRRFGTDPNSNQDSNFKQGEPGWRNQVHPPSAARDRRAQASSASSRYGRIAADGRVPPSPSGRPRHTARPPPRPRSASRPAPGPANRATCRANTRNENRQAIAESLAHRRAPRARRTRLRATPRLGRSSARRSTSASTSSASASPPRCGHLRRRERRQHRHREDATASPALVRRRPPRASIAGPPAAWTVTRRAPIAAALRTPPATVFGMSWNLRSRKTSRRARASRATTAGPAAVNSSFPTL